MRNIVDHIANPQPAPDAKGPGESLEDMAKGIVALLPTETIAEAAERVKAATGYDGALVVIW